MNNGTGLLLLSALRLRQFPRLSFLPLARFPFLSQRITQTVPKRRNKLVPHQSILLILT